MKHLLKPKIIAAVSIIAAVVATPLLATAASSDPNQQGSVGIEARVPTNPPTTGATITVPANGQTVTQLPITVSGICPNGLLVKLFKNEVFSGSAQCNGSYSISTDLFNGTNEIVARVYDALDQAGPDSNKITVTFNDTSFGANASRVTLTSNFAKRGANPGERLSWPVTLSGGTAPYAVSVDWGDGRNELISRTAPGTFDITHTYDSPGVFNLLIKATDTGGAAAFLQLVSVANGPIGQDAGSTNAGVITKTEVVWWPALISIFLVIISFWLGRRHQLVSLRKEMEERVHY